MKLKYEVQPWTIDKLIREYKKKNLNLNPPYQRNNIWAEKAQKTLISSIKDGLPIPAFFLHDRGNGKYDIADGQQRTRAIIAYIEDGISDLKGSHYSGEIDDYQLPVIVIDESLSQDAIRQFYVTVNNTGLRLNNPELTKAKHFSTDVLKLVEELASHPKFETLGIFTSKQSDRMIDREFVEELVAQLHHGIGDKKNDTKKLYDNNLDRETINTLSERFQQVLEIIGKHPEFELSKTRYSQRNDFYTLFGFVDKNKNVKDASFKTFFAILDKIQLDISPSNESGQDLQFYAFNCVSQSNSKTAREDRLKFFEDLLLNKGSKPNKLQRSLLKYYGLSESDMVVTLDGYKVIDPIKIQTQFKK